MFSWTPHSHTGGIQTALYPYISQWKGTEQRHRELKFGPPLVAGRFKVCNATPSVVFRNTEGHASCKFLQTHIRKQSCRELHVSV